MNMNEANYPSAKVKKFGVIGTSCAGKTTLVYKLLGRLKERGIHADGILQQDRRFSFERARLEDDPMAQWSFIMNQIKAEADMALRPGTDVMVSDRSPLDFYAYYEWQYGENKHLKNMVLEWCSTTFTCMYLVDPLPYVDDGARLDEKGRDEADTVIRKLAEEAKLWDTQVVLVDDKTFKREEVYSHICKQITEKVLTNDELLMLPAILGVKELLVGGSYAYNRATKFSDVDIYLVGDTSLPTGHPHMKTQETLVRDAFGINVEVRQVNREVALHLASVQGFRRITRG